MERYARFQGAWYPEDASALSAMIKTKKTTNGNRFAILPHAGLMYSALYINEYFSALSSEIKRIIIISPSHYHYLESDVLITANFTSSHTPLGTIKTEKFPFGLVADSFIQDEHGVEMVLPFIAKAGDIAVSYILISSLSSVESATKIALMIEKTMDDATGIIASSDFTHYGALYGYMPYGINGYDRVIEEDRKIAELMADNNWEEAVTRARGGTICGIAPSVITSIIARNKKMKGRVGMCGTSADSTRDRNNFVSYCTVLWR